MPSFFKPNPKLEEELGRQPTYHEGLAAETARAADIAKALAPVLSGSYRDGIKVQIIDKKVYLSGTDWKSGFIEFGTQDTPVFAPLRRGAQGAGLKFKASK